MARLTSMRVKAGEREKEEGRRKKEEGLGKEEGRRKKEEVWWEILLRKEKGRRKKEEGLGKEKGRRKKEEVWWETSSCGWPARLANISLNFIVFLSLKKDFQFHTSSLFLLPLQRRLPSSLLPFSFFLFPFLQPSSFFLFPSSFSLTPSDHPPWRRGRARGCRRPRGAGRRP